MTATSVRDISHTLAIRHRGGVVLRFVTVLRLITTSHLTLHCLCCDWAHVLPKCHFSLLLIFSPSSSLTFTDGTELATEGYEREYKCAAWAGGSSRRRGTVLWAGLEKVAQPAWACSPLQSLTSHSATGSYPGLVTTHQPPEQSRHHQMSANCKKVSTERR